MKKVVYNIDVQTLFEIWHEYHLENKGDRKHERCTAYQAGAGTESDKPDA